MDKDEYYIIKFGVIHNNDSIPNILCVGKIVGQKQIDIINKVNQKDIFDSAFNGNWKEHILRLFSYGLIFIAIVFALLWLYVTIDEYIEKCKAKKMQNTITKEFPDLHPTVMESFATGGEYYIHNIHRLLDIFEGFDDHELRIVSQMLTNGKLLALNSNSFLNYLMVKGYLKNSKDGELYVDSQLKKSIELLNESMFNHNKKI